MHKVARGRTAFTFFLAELGSNPRANKYNPGCPIQNILSHRTRRSWLNDFAERILNSWAWIVMSSFWPSAEPKSIYRGVYGLVDPTVMSPKSAFFIFRMHLLTLIWNGFNKDYIPSNTVPRYNETCFSETYANRTARTQTCLLSQPRYTKRKQSR